jgi:phosphate transport system protein
MVREAIDSFIKKDINLANKVITSDNEADTLRDKICAELINDYMLKDAATATRAVPLLLIARHLERICDHASNIAEDIIYMVEGKTIKHHHEELKK